ncbi:MAG: phosphate signaling complex protein PhoU [Deltaproteobacteria bacterium]|nr:phosphate signaling complex protein PhoU [Deltaproteobacteria bacterium]
MLEKRMNRLREMLITEASLVESMLQKSIQGLLQKSIGLLHEVIEQDEPLVNGYDIEIDKLCTQIAALYQPGPKALRTLLTMLKANYDIERAGDHAVNISQSAVEVIPYDFRNVEDILSSTANAAFSMFHDALTAFVKEDAKLAEDVLARDDHVDRLRDECVRIFTEEIKKRPEQSAVYMNLTRIIRSLERVADLATNIAEYALFIIRGEISKHGRDEHL